MMWWWWARTTAVATYVFLIAFQGVSFRADAFTTPITTTTAVSERWTAIFSTASTTTTSSSLPDNIKSVWGIEPRLSNFPNANFPFGTQSTNKPPILQLPQFLSADECRQIREWATSAMESGVQECDDYLNYRVNQEVEQGGVSTEGQALIDDCNVQESSLSASNRGGFRIRLDNQFVETMLKERLLNVLGMENREFVFEEGAWIRPTPRTVVVRDQTVVFYGPGNGVPPHVDGKDGTLLVYLCDVPDGVGGRTVFPEDDFANTPVEGSALLYRSKEELLHYSEAMTGSHEKWVMQLLLDYNHNYQPGDTITCFRTGTSYVWDGQEG